MSRLPGFLLYWLAVLIGVAGLLNGGLPLLKYAIKQLEGNNFGADLDLDSYNPFPSEIILMLSLMLLILVHIGHVLAGGLRFTKSGKVVAPEIQPGVLSQTPPRTSNPSPSESVPPVAVDIVAVDEKLARLVKPLTDKSEH